MKKVHAKRLADLTTLHAAACQLYGAKLINEIEQNQILSDISVRQNEVYAQIEYQYSSAI